MSLMDRIKVKPFLSFSEDEKHAFIRDVRNLRTKKLNEPPKTRKRKATAKKATTKRARQTAEQKALKALQKLSPAQLAAIEKLMGGS